MTEVTIPTGGSRDGWIQIWVNGAEQWVKAGVPTELDASEVEVLTNAGITFTTMVSGTFVGADAANGVYTFNGEPAVFEDIIDVEQSYFDPATDIDELGIKPHLTGGGGLAEALLQFTPEVFATVSGGCTLVVEMFVDDVYAQDGVTARTNTASYGGNVFVECRKPALIMLGVDGGAQMAVNEDLPIPDQINKVAMRLGLTDLALSVNGAPAHVRPEGGAFGDAPFGQGPLTILALSTGEGVNSRIRSFAFYPEMTDAELATLSAL